MKRALNHTKLKALALLVPALLSAGCSADKQPTATSVEKPTNPHFYIRYIANTKKFRPRDLGAGNANVPSIPAMMGYGSDGMHRFLSITAQAGSSADKELRWASENGTEMGKLYAALLIRRYDQWRADDLLKGLETDDELAPIVQLVKSGKVALKPDENLEADLWSKPEPPLDPELEQLASADRFSGLHVGFSSQTSEEYKLYESALKLGAKAAPQLEWIAANGSAAGQLYAALALYKIDKEKGIAAFSKLTKSNEQVECANGCADSNEKVAKLAADGMAGKLKP